MGVSSGLDKILLMYLRSWSSDVACFHSYSLGRHSVVVLLICSLCTINVGVLYLYLICFVSFWPWSICTGIACTFIFTSFSSRIRDSIPCFPYTTLAYLISKSCHRLDRFTTIFFLSIKALHTSCTQIGMHNPYAKNPPIHIPNHYWKTPHVDLKFQLTDLAHLENIPCGQTLLMLYFWLTSL